jgi:formate dehydrogenase subunit delta
VNEAELPDPADRAGWPPEIRLGHDVVRNLAWMEPEARTEAVATHLRKFWDPRMRRAIAQLVRAGDPRIDLVLAEAVVRYFMDDIDRAEIAEPSGG